MRIPIKYLNNSDTEEGPFYTRRPIVTLYLRYEPEHEKHLGPREVDWKVCRALIDTGADLNYADEALIEAMGAVPRLDASVDSATSNIKAKTYIAQIMCPPSSLAINADLVALPRRSSSTLYPCILGTSFLQLFRLHLDFPRNSFFLELSE